MATFRELQADLNALGERAVDPSPLLPVLGESFRDAERTQFARGRGWKPLSPAYAAQKAREGRSPRVGVYTGGLERSLTREGGRHVERFTSDKSFVIGSTNPVARLFSGKHKTRNQPKRQAVRIPPALRRSWLGWAQDYLAEGRLP